MLVAVTGPVDIPADVTAELALNVLADSVYAVSMPYVAESAWRYTEDNPVAVNCPVVTPKLEITPLAFNDATTAVPVTFISPTCRLEAVASPVDMP